MKKNKGFTLPELIATIVILSTLIIIAVPSYLKVVNSTKQKNYEQKVAYIKSKALEYAHANNIDAERITVNKLVLLGYIAEDKNSKDETERVKNPTGGYFDCFKIDIKKSENDYNIDLIESNDCKEVEIENIKSKISIKAYEYNGQIGKSLNQNRDINWTNQDVLLYLDLNDKSIQLTDSEITWSYGGMTVTINNDITSTISTNTNYSNIMIIDSIIFLNTDVYATINTTQGPITINGVIKIDKEKPYVNVEVSKEWTNNYKKLTINGSDGTGSGIVAYHISTENTIPNQFKYQIADEELNELKLDVGIYYAYAKDAVGNISNAYKFQITNIDNERPICKYPIDATNWHQSYSSTYGCSSDSKSGCKTADQVLEVNENKEKVTLKWEIEDNLGNKQNCEYTVNTFVDTTPPTCTSTPSITTWTNQDRTVIWGCADDLSGCVKEEYDRYTTTNDNSITDYKIKAYEIYDLAGNKTSCPEKNVSVNVDKIPPTCSVSSSHNGWVNASTLGDGVLITGTCNDTGGSGCQKSSINSGYKKTEGSYNVSPGTVYDNAGNSTVCDATTVKIDITKPVCTLESAKDWTAQNRTLALDCTDNGGSGSGKDGVLEGRTYKTYTETTSYSIIFVPDVAGNTGSTNFAFIGIDKTGSTTPTAGSNCSMSCNTADANYYEDRTCHLYTNGNSCYIYTSYSYNSPVEEKQRNEAGYYELYTISKTGIRSHTLRVYVH